MIRERPITFESRGIPLRGILHEPSPERATRRGIVCCNAGVQAKAGPFRLYVRLARRWCEQGLWVLRFDFPGMGDSAGTLSDIHFDMFSLEDVRAAIESLCRESQIEDVLLFGMCSGARSALRSAGIDPRVRRLVLVSLPLMKATDFLMSGATLHLTRFLGKTRRWESWTRFVTFRSNYRLLWDSLRHGFRRQVRQSCVDPEVIKAVENALRRGQDLLFVYGSLDLYYESFLLGLQSRFSRGNGRRAASWRLEIIEGAGHIFPQTDGQRELIERLASLVAHHTAPTEVMVS